MDFFSVVKAQGVDEIASPTIPFEAPGGNTTPTVTQQTQGATITLTSNQTQIAPGETTKIQIQINTNGQEIREFAVYITYNPSLFEIVDADPNNANIQITYLDSVFTATENIVSQQTGTISIKASKSSGTASISSRVVAEFEVTALDTGVGEFNAVKENSLLVNANSIDILQSTSNVSLTVSEQNQITGTPIPTTPAITPTLTPKTGIFDEFGATNALFFGLILISAGIYLLRIRKSDKEKKI